MFTAQEIIDIAIRIEKNGEDYYRKALGKISNPTLESLLTFLADQESQHTLWLEELKESVKSSGEDWETAELSGSLLQHLVGDQKFSLDEVEVLEGDHVERLIDVAVEFEKDTILFFEMIGSISDAPDTLAILDKIIAEENHHIEMLKEYKSTH